MLDLTLVSVGAVRSLTLSLTLIAVLYQVSGTPRYQEMMHTHVCLPALLIRDARRLQFAIRIQQRLPSSSRCNTSDEWPDFLKLAITPARFVSAKPVSARPRPPPTHTFKPHKYLQNTSCCLGECLSFLYCVLQYFFNACFEFHDQFRTFHNLRRHPFEICIHYLFNRMNILLTRTTLGPEICYRLAIKNLVLVQHFLVVRTQVIKTLPKQLISFIQCNCISFA